MRGLTKVPDTSWAWQDQRRRKRRRTRCPPIPDNSVPSSLQPFHLVTPSNILPRAEGQHSLTNDNSDISTEVRRRKSRRDSSSSQQRRGGRSSGGSAEGREVDKRKKDDENNGVVGKVGGYLKRVKRQGYEEYPKRTLKDVSLTPTLESLTKGR